MNFHLLRYCINNVKIYSLQFPALVILGQVIVFNMVMSSSPCPQLVCNKGFLLQSTINMVHVFVLNQLQRTVCLILVLTMGCKGSLASPLPGWDPFHGRQASLNFYMGPSHGL